MAHGRNTYFSVEDSGATVLRNISLYVNASSMGRGNDVHDNTTYGQTGHTWTNGLTNATLQISGFWDKSASTGAATVLDSLVGVGLVGFEYGPEGNTSGFVKYSGECVLVSLEYSAPVGDLVAFTASFNVSGAVTKGTFSA